MGKSIAVIDNLIKHTLTLVKQLVEGFKNSFLLKVINIFMEQYYKSILQLSGCTEKTLLQNIANQ